MCAIFQFISINFSFVEIFIYICKNAKKSVEEEKEMA